MFDDYIALLKPLISFKSISTDSAHKEEIQKTAEYLQRVFEREGFTVSLIPTRTNPLVRAVYTVDEHLPTCFVYGHYDVQPTDDQAGWESDPFTLTERNGALYGRGAADNKGQFLVHLTAISKVIKENKLRYNIVFMVEGDEEGDSESLEQLLHEQPDLFKSDFVLVSDGQVVDNLPTLDIGFRGALNFNLIVSTSSNDLHSGLFGGSVPNAAHELSKMIAGLHNEVWEVTVPGFYNQVPLEAPSVPFNMTRFQEAAGVKKLLADTDVESYMRCALRPTIEVTTLKSGYLGEGYRNSIPGTAEAKINVRVCPYQSNEELSRAIAEYFARVASPYVTWELRLDEESSGVFIDIQNEYAGRAIQLLEDTFGNEVVLKYCGGTLPIIAAMQRELHTPQVMVAFANEDCNMHGANENITSDLIKKCLEFSYRFFSADTPQG